MDDRKRQRQIWQETKPEPCVRCEDWNKAGLSSLCPSCDATHLAAYDAKIEEEGLEQ